MYPSLEEINDLADSLFLNTLGNLYIPGTFLALREERKDVSRPVSWRKGNTNVVILHRRHEANNKTVKSGTYVKIDEAKNLLRTAHSRRAHQRILRSGKFKNKIGQVIWVKSSWVGPRVWCDNTDRVYKIIDREKGVL